MLEFKYIPYAGSERLYFLKLHYLFYRRIEFPANIIYYGRWHTEVWQVDRDIACTVECEEL